MTNRRVRSILTLSKENVSKKCVILLDCSYECSQSWYNDLIKNLIQFEDGLNYQIQEYADSNDDVDVVAIYFSKNDKTRISYCKEVIDNALSNISEGNYPYFIIKSESGYIDENETISQSYAYDIRCSAGVLSNPGIISCDIYRIFKDVIGEPIFD